MTSYSVLDSPIGDILLTATPDAAGEFALTGVYLDGQKYEPAIDPSWVRADGLFADVEKQLVAYFAGELTTFELPLAARGTDFQRRVWQALAAVPYGSTCSYGELAARVADRTRTRAVAAAVGHNPLTIVVPCHRVVGADGSLTGYAGGVERKRWLLDLETRVAADLPIR